jgi:hypothetical protein
VRQHGHRPRLRVDAQNVVLAVASVVALLHNPPRT